MYGWKVTLTRAVYKLPEYKFSHNSYRSVYIRTKNKPKPVDYMKIGDLITDKAEEHITWHQGAPILKVTNETVYSVQFLGKAKRIYSWEYEYEGR